MSNTRQRPPLNRAISVRDFQDFYWLKAELQEFCRDHGLSTSGGKIEISERIETFLRTGKRQRATTRRTATSSAPASSKPLTLDTVIHAGFKCGQRERAFFESVIGSNFRFTVRLQKFIKANVGKTYQDIVDAWYEQEEQKKSGEYRTKIAPQFEYNRFIRAYFDDPDNQSASLKDAIRQWKEVRSQPGPNIYIAQSERDNNE